MLMSGLISAAAAFAAANRFLSSAPSNKLSSTVPLADLPLTNRTGRERMVATVASCPDSFLSTSACRACLLGCPPAARAAHQRDWAAVCKAAVHGLQAMLRQQATL